MKKFAELCLYKQCLMFLTAVTYLVNTNIIDEVAESTNFSFKMWITLSSSLLQSFPYLYQIK